MRVDSSLPPSLLLRTLAAQRRESASSLPAARGPAASAASLRALERTQTLLPGVRTNQPRLFALLRSHELRTLPRAFDLPVAQEAPRASANRAPEAANAAPPASSAQSQSPTSATQDETTTTKTPPAAPLPASSLHPASEALGAPVHHGQGHPIAAAHDAANVASDAKTEAAPAAPPPAAASSLSEPAAPEETTARRFTQDDINALLKEYGHSAETRGAPLEYDLDGDGVVGPADLFTALANFDGHKTRAQTLLEGVQQMYGARAGEERYNPTFDMDNDGAIGPSDLFSVLANFGSLTN
ncbi:MAG: hypothetical protein D6824_09580, partial [Planctomycetota bacterium]